MKIKCFECNKEFDLKEADEIFDYDIIFREYKTKNPYGWFDCCCIHCGVVLNINYEISIKTIQKSDYQSI